MNRKIAWVASAGFISGSAMRLKVRNSELPSIRAASTISSGKVAIMYCRMKKTTVGDAIAGRISGTYVLTRCSRYMKV